MKKIQLSLTMIFIALSTISVIAQKNSKNPENCVSQGKFIIDAYYGYPYVMGNLIKDANSNSNSSYTTEEKVVNYNHIGGKFEYMINDVVGMGLDYTHAKVSYTYLDSYNTNVNGQLQYGKFTESLIKQRFLMRVNIHFATTAELDPYATAGVGYKQTIYKTDNPNNVNYDLSFFNAFPVAVRIGAGLRWFFTNNIGISIEAGIGGPAIQGGLSAKF